MSEKDGGPAFPVDFSRSWSFGMTLRDWFAGQAIMTEARYDMSYEDRAESAYRLADAMLKAREKKAGD